MQRFHPRLTLSPPRPDIRYDVHNPNYRYIFSIQPFWSSDILP
jgi:hypothetical protein